MILSYYYAGWSVAISAEQESDIVEARRLVTVEFVHRSSPYSTARGVRCYWMMRQSFSGVAGMSRCRTPSGFSASTSALVIAAGAPIAPASPLPSSICAGMAFVTRETSAIIALFYGILFLLGWRLPRPYFFLIAGGFLVVMATDITYLASMTGDPLYRFHLSLGAVSIDNPLDPAIAAAFPVQNGLDTRGLIAASRVIQPVLMLFTAHQFGAVFYFVIPAGLWCWINRTRSDPQFEIAGLSGLLAAIWFLTLSYVFIFLWLDPRYFTVTVYAAVLVVALWLRAPRLRRISFGLIASLALPNLLMIYLDNKQLMFGEKALVSIARAFDEPIYTDGATLRGASFLLDHTAPGHKVIPGLAPAGGLFFYNPSPLRAGPNPDNAGKVEPAATWTLLQSIVEQPRISARILQASGLEPILPVGVARKLDPPLHRCYLYRLPPQ